MVCWINWKQKFLCQLFGEDRGWARLGWARLGSSAEHYSVSGEFFYKNVRA